MYATTFSNNSVLRVDLSKFDITSEWLTKHGVKFEAFRYIRSTGDSYAVFEFISAPQSVIDAHNAKFNPQPESWETDEYVSCDPNLFNVITFVLSEFSPEQISGVAIAYEIDHEQSFNDIVESFVRVAHQYFDFPLDIEKAIRDYIYRNESSTNSFFDCWDDAPFTSNEYFALCNTTAELKAEYRRLSKIHHPDCGGDAATFAVIAEQYQNCRTILERIYS